MGDELWRWMWMPNGPFRHFLFWALMAILCLPGILMLLGIANGGRFPGDGPDGRPPDNWGGGDGGG
jgi:hypothetical protein